MEDSVPIAFPRRRRISATPRYCTAARSRVPVYYDEAAAERSYYIYRHLHDDKCAHEEGSFFLAESTPTPRYIAMLLESDQYTMRILEKSMATSYVLHFSLPSASGLMDARARANAASNTSAAILPAMQIQPHVPQKHNIAGLISFDYNR